MKPIRIPRGVALRDRVSASILSQARRLLGAVTWLSSQTRPDLQVLSSLDQQSLIDLTETLDHTEWMTCLILEGLYPDFSVEKREEFYPKHRTWHVIDTKSVYDHLQSNTPQSGVDDCRTALDFPVAVESLRRLRCTLRWEPAGVQLVRARQRSKI